MQGDRYLVKKGDNLCRIAQSTLGSAREWPRIWKYNNRPAVVRITGRSVPNPDAIYVGQLLLIPRFAAQPVPRAASTEPAFDHLPAAIEPGSSEAALQSAQLRRQSPGPSSVTSSSGVLSERLERLKIPVAYKFELGALPWPPQNIGTATVRISMSGDVLLVGKQSYPASYVVSNGKLEGQLATEANHAFGKLVSENSYVYEPAAKRITMKSMLISQSTTPNTPAAAVGVEMDSSSPLPKIRAEIKLPRLDGKIGVFKYVATDVTVALEVTPNPTGHDGLRDAQRIRVVDAVPATARASARSAASAELLIGAGIVLGGAALIFGTVVEDFFTWGVGILNDAPTLTLGAAAISAGISVMRSTPTDSLPKNLGPAVVTPSSKIVVAGSR